jgi:sec-independent protein translocase protein TatA
MFGFGLGWSEVLLVCAIGLLLFGNRLPGLARSLGKSLASFKKEVNDIQEDLHGAAR